MENSQKKVLPLANMSDILDYEIRSSWWACWIWWDWGQNLAGTYFAWKVNRKYKKYAESIVTHNQLNK